MLHFFDENQNQRMMIAGYNESYRQSTIGHAIRIHDKMIREHEDGTRPLHRPHDWHAEERRIDKRKKKNSWATRGGHTAPIIVPATPDGELAALLKQIAEEESVGGLKFKVVEKGGRMVENMVQKSNPTATPGCNATDCLACRRGGGKGGNCRKGNIQYEMACRLCPDDGKCAYIGETSRNLYTRGAEHVGKYETGNCDSFMVKHLEEKHRGEEADFDAKVTGVFKDCLTRQVSEGVQIRRCGYSVLNSKSEWHQPSLWRVRNEVERG